MNTLPQQTLTAGVATPVACGGYATGVLIANESSLSLQVSFGSFSAWLPAWTIDYYDLTTIAANGNITLTPSMLSSAINAPSSVALLTVLAAGDKLTGTYPCALNRQTNLGNGSIATTTTNTLINDGSAAGTQIIETTPTGEATSAFVVDNSGNLTLRTLNSNVWAVILSIISGGASPATALFHGIADNVPATGVTAGALPAGVTSPNYLPLTGGTLTGQLTLDKAMSGADVILAQLQASDASPAARWTISQRFSDSALYIKDQTNGHVPIVLGPTAGTSTYFGTLTPLHGNGTFGIRGDFSGTSSGTFATGAGTTPTICLTEDDQSGSSMTMGAVISGTNVVITAGAAHTWLGVAL